MHGIRLQPGHTNKNSFPLLHLAFSVSLSASSTATELHRLSLHQMSWPQPRWAPPFATTGLKSTPNLPLIDLRHLSQPELLSLSICSSSSLHRLQTVTAGVSTPKIDRSVFNESAGSRKQTFLRLRLAPRNNNASSSSNSIPAVPFQSTERHPLDEENSQIIYLLKSLFGSYSHSVENKNENNHNLFSVPVIYNEYVLLSFTNNAELQNVDFSQGVKSLEVNHLNSTRIVESSSKKRKRGRPWKNENVNFGNNELVLREQIESITILCDDVKVQNKKKEEMEMVNKNGVVVDFKTGVVNKMEF